MTDSQPGSGTGPGLHRGRRVLVAEDHYSLARMLQLHLDAFGCQVVGPVPSGREALALVDTQTVDMALLDVLLQDGTAFPVAERLETMGVPFVFTTGYDDDAVIPDAFRDVPRLVKPFSEAELRASLERLDGSPPGS